MNRLRSVLIVDRSPETREVLQTALERRGVRTLSTGRAERGLKLARQHHPDLVVLDLEMDDLPAEQFADYGADGNRPIPILAETKIGAVPCCAGEASPPQCQPRLVLLGSLRRQADRLPGGEFMAKPYHYGPLIRRIEELLDNTRESVPCRRCSSSAESIRAAASS